MLGLGNLFNKDYPEFWKKYINSFDKSAEKYTVISIETSGTNSEKDVIMAIAATSVIDNRIIIKNSFSLAIQHSTTITNELVSEFSLTSDQEKFSEIETLEKLITYISNSILIGHRINFDIEIINATLSKYKLGKLKNEAFDIEAMYNKVRDTNEKKYSLEDMSINFNIALSDRNSVADEAYSIALLFLKLKSVLNIK